MLIHIHYLFVTLSLVLELATCHCVHSPEVANGEPVESEKRGQANSTDNGLPAGAIIQFGTVQKARNRMVSVTFLEDGETLAITGQDRELILREVRTGKKTRRLENHFSVAFTPDGKTMASGWAFHRNNIQILEVSTGKEIAQVPYAGGMATNRDLAFRFSPDGRYLAASGGANPKDEPPLLRFWDAETGKEIVRKNPIRVMVSSLAFSPNGRLLATVCELPGQPIHIWDLATGEEVRQIPTRERGEKFLAASLAFSLDGDSLVAVHQHLACWNIHTGKIKWRVPIPALPDIHCLAYSPNGQILAVGTEKKGIHLLEAATGRERAELQGHQDAVWSLSFSPDGLMLASAAADESFVVWDVTGRIKGADQKNTPLGDKELDAAWSDLSGEDAAKAWKSIIALAARPEQAVPLLKKRLPANAPLDPDRLTKLLADLDSEDFEAREKATKDLAALGHVVAPALRKLLDAAPAVDKRTRVEKLLGKLGQDGILTEELRCLRALEILEYAATPEAKKLLETEAKGAAQAQITQGAKAALDRLAKQVPAKP